MKHLGKLLGHYQLLEKMSARQLAATIGISPSTLARIEAGEMMDGRSLSLVLAWVLQIEPTSSAGPHIDEA